MSESHKSLLIVDKNLNTKSYSVEEALAKRVTNWKGWKCSAGFDNLHISSDGNIFLAACEVNGFQGNVFYEDISLPEKWITCTKELCVCGSDMQLRKAKNEEDIVKTYQEPPISTTEGSSALEAEPRWVAPFHFEAHRDTPKNVTWDLGRRCNFSCSYCPPSTSNHFESHKSWGSLKHAADNILKRFSRGQKIKWVFTGGEPTLNPSFMDLVKYLTQQNQIVHVQSNGSRNQEYFEELIQMACIGLSYHFENTNRKHFVEICQKIIAKKAIDSNAQKWWFGVRLMVGPNDFEEAHAVRNEILSLPEFHLYGHISMSPLYQRENQEQLMNYNQNHFEDFQKFS